MNRINKISPLVRSHNVNIGNWRAFEVVARHLNFRHAAEELSLTQSAVSRQIQSLETDVGASLFERSTRSVALTEAGKSLLQVVLPWMERMDAAVDRIRGGLARPSVSITTFASFASMWVIPKLEAFQRLHPDMDIRIDANDAFISLENSDVDLALRYGTYAQMPKGAIRLFDDVLSPMISPWLLKAKLGAASISTLQDIQKLTLIELSDVTHSQFNWLTWEGWLAQHGAKPKAATQWLKFNYTYQTVQAALAGQGMVLARLPLVEESLKNGDLIEPLPKLRIKSPMAYWLIARAGSLEQPQVLAFSNWLQKQARETRRVIALA